MLYDLTNTITHFPSSEKMLLLRPQTFSIADNIGRSNAVQQIYQMHGTTIQSHTLKFQQSNPELAEGKYYSEIEILLFP